MTYHIITNLIAYRCICRSECLDIYAFLFYKFSSECVVLFIFCYKNIIVNHRNLKKTSIFVFTSIFATFRQKRSISYLIANVSYKTEKR